MRKQFFFADVINKKNKKCTNRFRPFTQYFKAHFAVISASSFGMTLQALRAFIWGMEFFPLFSTDPLKLLQTGMRA